MKKTVFGCAAMALVFAATPVLASTVFSSSFESVPGAPSYGTYTTVATADGWTGQPQIELQNHVAGSPAANGGNVFVELDADFNSAMSRTIAAAGSYTLSFLYSPRPNVGAASNGIDVLLNGITLAPTFTGNGGPDTSWLTKTLGFTAGSGSTLTFKAVGTNDSLGGYLDNIQLSSSAVPEPATWAMMIVGTGLIGAAMRRRAPALRYA